MPMERSFPNAPRWNARLFGFPGKGLTTHRGDMYSHGPSQEMPDDGIDFTVRGGMHVHHFRTRANPFPFDRDKFRILRKPPAIVLALMKLVYDSAHPASDLVAPEERRWVGEKGS